MNKFKIGDKVRYINITDWKHNELATISKVAKNDYEYVYSINFINYTYCSIYFLSEKNLKLCLKSLRNDKLEKLGIL